MVGLREHHRFPDGLSQEPTVTRGINPLWALSCSRVLIGLQVGLIFDDYTVHFIGFATADAVVDPHVRGDGEDHLDPRLPVQAADPDHQGVDGRGRRVAFEYGAEARPTRTVQSGGRGELSLPEPSDKVGHLVDDLVCIEPFFRPVCVL